MPEYPCPDPNSCTGARVHRDQRNCRAGTAGKRASAAIPATPSVTAPSVPVTTTPGQRTTVPQSDVTDAELAAIDPATGRPVWFDRVTPLPDGRVERYACIDYSEYFGTVEEQNQFILEDHGIQVGSRVSIPGGDPVNDAYTHGNDVYRIVGTEEATRRFIEP